jgi:isochorismate synthase
VRAVSRPLEGDVDLNDIARGDGYLFARDGVGVAGRGVAARVPIDDVPTFLAAIDHDDRAGGARPLAMGVVPFKPGTPCDLIVPKMTVVKADDGRRWVTTIDDAPLDLDTPPRPQPRAQAFNTEPLTPVDRYLAAVDAARRAVRDGRLAKVVIARAIRVSSDEPIDIHAVLLRLRASFGSSFRYSIDGFVGAMPELLVDVHGNDVRAFPFAGTTPRTGDPDTDQRAAAELLASAKNQLEHRIVIDTIHDTLLPWCSYLDWEPQPSIVAVANVQHLGTRMEGHLSDPRPNVLELVRALAPTPAVGGSPRDEALALIEEIEGFERGRYAGSVGWVDAVGDGTWAVALRCAEFSDDRCSARLVAGGGIVADSEPLAELAETQAKFQAMLSAIVRP